MSETAPTTVAAPPGPHRPRVLVAVDGTAASDHGARAARELFGTSATYLAINVGVGPYSAMSWAYVSPLGGPAASFPQAWYDEIDAEAVTATARAKADARQITETAGLEQVTAIGDIGDPTSAIIRAAHQHHADVVVVGADQRSWVSRLFAGSVERLLLREADFSVLVVSGTDVADTR